MIDYTIDTDEIRLNKVNDMWEVFARQAYTTKIYKDIFTTPEEGIAKCIFMFALLKIDI